jgi:hypothetical protein
MIYYFYSISLIYILVNSALIIAISWLFIGSFLEVEVSV